MDDMNLQKGKVLSEILLNILCLFAISHTALERIRQDFLSDTQEAINSIEIRSSKENIYSKKKDQHRNQGASV